MWRPKIKIWSIQQAKSNSTPSIEAPHLRQTLVPFFMPGHPQPLTVTAVPTYRQLLLYKIYGSTNVVWSLHPVTLKLTKWFWYAALCNLETCRYISDYFGKGLFMQQSAWRQAHCVNIANIINSLGQAACVHCFNQLVANQSSRKSPYTYLSLDAMPGSMLQNVHKVDADTWVSLYLW